VLNWRLRETEKTALVDCKTPIAKNTQNSTSVTKKASQMQNALAGPAAAAVLQPLLREDLSVSISTACRSHRHARKKERIRGDSMPAHQTFLSQTTVEFKTASRT
jgi:hypothetical protein